MRHTYFLYRLAKSAMVAQHWYGWAEMKRDLAEIRDEATQLRAAHGKATPGGQ